METQKEERRAGNQKQKRKEERRDLLEMMTHDANWMVVSAILISYSDTSRQRPRTFPVARVLSWKIPSKTATGRV